MNYARIRSTTKKLENSQGGSTVAGPVDLLKLSSLAGTNEGLSFAFEAIPADANLISFALADTMILNSTRDALKKSRKLPNNLLGALENVGHFTRIEIGVADKTAALVAAKPLDNSSILAEFDDLKQSIQWVAAA